MEFAVMSSTLILERSFASQASAPGAGATPAQAPSYCAVPRCTLKFEKCAGGCKIQCICDDEVACATLQNLCRSLAGSLCCCTCTWNGMTVCQCNLCCGNCQVECTPKGVCITCTSGDKQCAAMIQACCEACKCCCDSGCCCTISFGGTPVCCCAA
jgi:hypothetical protein